MEHALSCNNLKCRKELNSEALVTTCSHIFCLECAGKLGFPRNGGPRRQTCPACNACLTSPDVAAFTTINPSEDYKTIVLSGLSPNAIMECAGRALSFWAYQTTQDICYKQHLYKTLNEKYTNLMINFEKTINDFQMEINTLQMKLSNAMSDCEKLQRKNSELAQAYTEKNRKLSQTQVLYDRVKRRAELGQIQQAASDAVELHIGQTGPESQRPDMTLPDGGMGFFHGLCPQDQSQYHDSVTCMNTGLPRSNGHYSGKQDRILRPIIPSRDEVSHAPIGSTIRQRFSNRPILGTTSKNIHMPAFDASGRLPSEGISSFASNRTGISGLGLTTGLKVSQPDGSAELGAPVRNR